MHATEEQVMGFATAQPAVMAWLMDHQGNEFADSLTSYLMRRGELTPGQISAVQRKLDVAGAATSITTHALEAKFATALTNRVKRPRIRLDTFTFSHVPKGQNAGGIYVKEGKGEEAVYLGKALAGRFYPSPTCTPDQQARIVAAASAPDEAARAYGRRTGNCCICGLELTADESIERMVGPICAEKWGL